MTEGFMHLGWREWLAVAMATTIILDWAVWRYTRFRPGAASREEA